jgi:hypothetical protein
MLSNKSPIIELEHSNYIFLEANCISLIGAQLREELAQSCWIDS